MSKPDIVPKLTASGITVDPRTLDRVIPESRRPDGTLRKEIKIRPGYTPQEDVSRFRGSRQKQMDATTLPKGHIIGWTPPPKPAAPANSTAGLSKSAKKNAKRKEKREEKKVEKVKDSWEDDDEEEGEGGAQDTTSANKPVVKTQNSQAAKSKDNAGEDAAEALAKKLEGLDVQ